MEIILLEKVRNLGTVGEKVLVKAGYARNYLVPYGKAVIATAANLVKFNKMREELEQKAAEALKSAEERAAKLAIANITIPVKATEEGKLFGSVNTSTVAQALQAAGYEVKRSEVNLPQGVIRQIGEYEVGLLLHTDVNLKIKINVVAMGLDSN